MYIKVKDRELFHELDENLVLPINWTSFIKKMKTKNNLIIKSKDNCECTNCHHIFEKKLKINEQYVCPKCKNLYTVKSARLSYYEFKDEVAILDKYKDYYIVRQFKVCTIFSNKKMHSYYFEYARNIYDNNFALLHQITNENVYFVPNAICVQLRKKNSQKWRYFISYYSLQNEFIYYPDNLKELLQKIDNLKYSEIWTLASHADYFDLVYLIKNYNASVELLTKMKLYNLALCPKTFKNKKTFNERFYGLTKDFIPFIQEYNLDLGELEILSRIKIKNINYIKKFNCVDVDYFDILKKYNVNPIMLADKTDFSKNNYNEYIDYLKMVNDLGFDMKDKRVLYPGHIKKEHDVVLQQYKINKSKITNEAIVKRYKRIKKNTFESKKYIIFPAKNNDSLIDESKQQNNCVRTYAERIANKECDIYFMRLTSNVNQSLVTVEVQKNKIVQKKTKNNNKTTPEQNKFLDLWEKKILGRSVSDGKSL